MLSLQQVEVSGRRLQRQVGGLTCRQPATLIASTWKLTWLVHTVSAIQLVSTVITGLSCYLLYLHLCEVLLHAFL